jgi:sulfite reductase beta subunit-like hemoprotein
VGLKETIKQIKECGLTTWGACGDVVRNTMGPAAPIQDEAHIDSQRLSEEISEKFLARSSAYSDIWLNGEKLEVDENGAPSEVEDDIYGKLYLPRKFKIGIAVAPRNDTDILSQDIGFVPHAPNGKVEGYTVFVGGGFGMTHGMKKTHPVLAKPLFYAKRENIVEAAVEIVKVQRDFGNREDRKRARMKYLIEERGLEWFRKEVESRLSFTPEEPKPVTFNTVADMLGWHEQGDGKLFLCVHVAGGRIQDKNGVHYQAAFRKICREFGCDVKITSNTNMVFCDIDPKNRETIDKILRDHNVPNADNFTEARKTAHACVALPTCGLALAESERIFQGFLDDIDKALYKFGLEKEPLLIRMTGCPNGCARPYNADIGLVGRAPGKYALFLGGSIAGDRLCGLHEKMVPLEDVPKKITPLLKQFSQEKEDGETFSHWWGRTFENGPEPSPDQFHVELEERAKKLAEKKEQEGKVEVAAG